MITVLLLALVLPLLAACGSPVVDQRAEAAPRPAASPPSSPTKPTDGRAAVERVAAARAVGSFRATTDQDALALDNAVQALGTALSEDQTATARADELTAQADFDRIRALDSGNVVNTAAIDGLASQLAENEPFGGLHAIERDLWSPAVVPGQGSALIPGLLAQARVARFLLAKETLDPEAIGVAAADELSWVDEMALPGFEELYSHRDTVDTVATIEAADSAFSDIEPLGRLVAPALTAAVAVQFTRLLAAVAALGPPDEGGDASLAPTARLALSQQVDATATPLAQLAATLIPFGTEGPPS